MVRGECFHPCVIPAPLLSNAVILILVEMSDNLDLEDVFKQFAAQMPLRGLKLLQASSVLLFHLAFCFDLFCCLKYLFQTGNIYFAIFIFHTRLNMAVMANLHVHCLAVQ